MIFVDASALVAILTREANADELWTQLEADPRRITSPIAFYEATLALTRKRTVTVSQASRFLRRFLSEADIRLVSIGEPETALAVDAFGRLGKGRHPARLNMGDCFAYASCRAHGAALLFAGEDFALTDIEAA